MSAVNPLERLSETELVAEHCRQGANTHFLSEMLRRQMNASADLGNKMWWLNLWLLVFTVVISILTGVLVWTTAPHAASAWVLWGHVIPIVGRGEPHWLIDSAASTEIECLRRRDQKLKLLSATPSPSEGLKFENKIDAGGTVSQETYRGADLVRRETIQLVCLPDTIDPRGPKEK